MGLTREVPLNFLLILMKPVPLLFPFYRLEDKDPGRLNSFSEATELESSGDLHPDMLDLRPFPSTEYCPRRSCDPPHGHCQPAHCLPEAVPSRGRKPSPRRAR